MSTAVKKADNLRDAIFRLEDEVLKRPPAELDWVHRFAPGMYAREMIVPPGVLVTGAIHKTEHISIMLSGKMIIPDENGSKVIEAPLIEIAQPGVKRVGVALTEVRWITFHPTDETDIGIIEDEIATNDPAEVPEFTAIGHELRETGPAMLQRNQGVMISEIPEGEK